MFEKIQYSADMENAHNLPEMTSMHRIPKHQSETVKNRFPEKTPIAMAYVPVQQWSETYKIEDGFCRGTVFPELDLPFSPGEGCL
jgi:2-methylcitrate dehydratase PrpD